MAGFRKKVVPVLMTALMASSVGVAVGAGSAGAAPKGAPIKIGFVIPKSGEEGPLFTGIQPAAQAWAKYTNANGGVAGHPVKIVVGDSQSSPPAALAAVQSLVTQGVVAVVSADPISEGSTVPYLVSKNIPILGIGYSSVLLGAKNAFNSLVSTLGTSLGELAAAKQVGKTNFTSFYCLESPSCKTAASFYQSNAPTFGVTYEGGFGISATQPSYTAECLQAISSGTNFLQLDTNTTTQGAAAKTCYQQGYKGVIGALSQEINIPAMDKVANAKWAGTLNAFPWWVNTAPVKTFRSAMKKYAPSYTYQNLTGTAMWTVLQLFAKAVSANKGAVTPASVIADYGKIKNQTLGGLLAQPVTYKANSTSAPVTCAWTYTFTSGNASPKSIPVKGKSGNGASGGLASTCPPAGVVKKNLAG
ncbi:MAG TPA: ABC transporter substrate-binding protein [Acidimicrobiales bacterium]|nr:ABC transporter substrate-binding protein [Acidimicrobiales bacterium]